MLPSSTALLRVPYCLWDSPPVGHGRTCSVKLAYFSPIDVESLTVSLADGGVPSEISVWDNAEALGAFAVTRQPGGVAWWSPDRSEPTMSDANARLGFLHQYGPSPYAFDPLDPQRQLSIRRVWLDNADVQLLIAQLYLDLLSRYPEPGSLVLSLESADIVDGVGALLMAELDGEPVGCGAFRVIDERPGSAEIKH